eukprot:3873077-Ditylum_brightwellii.AAC.1
MAFYGDNSTPSLKTRAVTTTTECATLEPPSVGPASTTQPLTAQFSVCLLRRRLRRTFARRRTRMEA